jgi:hypothetical protein
MFKAITATVVTASLVGCAAVTPGPADVASEARKVKPAVDTTAIYFCREWALAGGGASLYPRINGNEVATLETKTFTRVDLPLGEYEIALAYYDKGHSAFFKSIARDPVKMEVINSKAGEVYQYWIGVAGSVFGGALTIDHFDSKAQALDCIENSTYVSPRQFSRTKGTEAFGFLN